MRGGWLYMMADRYRGTIYTGVTADIAKRIYQHRTQHGSKFVKRYDLLRLVYAEPYERSPARRPSRSGAARGRSS